MLKWLRLLMLVTLLIFRFGFNYLETGGYGGGQLRITGYVDKTDQSRTDCTMIVGRFWVRTAGKCIIKQEQKIEVVGRAKASVIDKILGRMWVDGKVKSLDQKLETRSLFANWRYKLNEVSQALLPEPEAGLVAGIVLGQKSGMAADFNQALINSGTVHIVVASGYNVMVVGNVALTLLLVVCGRRKAAWGAVLVMVIYAMLAGGEPPVTRAVIMGGLFLVGGSYGKNGESGWTLILVAWLMLFIDPFLLESISFQLTVAASVGLFWLGPRLTKLIPYRTFTETLSAQILTAPIIWWHFQRVSFVGLLSNLFVLPLVPAIMMSGSVMVLAGVMWLPLGFLVMPVVYALTHVLVVIVYFFK